MPFNANVSLGSAMAEANRQRQQALSQRQRAAMRSQEFGGQAQAPAPAPALGQPDVGRALPSQSYTPFSQSGLTIAGKETPPSLQLTPPTFAPPTPVGFTPRPPNPLLGSPGLGQTPAPSAPAPYVSSSPGLGMNPGDAGYPKSAEEEVNIFRQRQGLPPIPTIPTPAPVPAPSAPAFTPYGGGVQNHIANLLANTRRM